MRRIKGAGWARNVISKLMSYSRAGRPWVDAHLPLIPVAVRNGRSALHSQRPPVDIHSSGWRTRSESYSPSSVVNDWSDLLRGAS